MDDSSVNQGKDGLLIPQQTQVVNSSVVSRCPHRSEIQSIVIAEMKSSDNLILGSVDSLGHLIVSKMDANDKESDKWTYSVVPRDFGVGESGWAGLCFSPIQLSVAAVARSYCKSIDVYDQDIHLRTLRTLLYPSSLSFMQSLGSEGSVIAVTEGCQLSIWDLRMKENGGCVQRISGSIGDIYYAVCSSETGIAIGGADRTVTVYDPRRWSALSRWVHCSKYEITGLAFSSINSDYIYIQGVDYEVIACTIVPYSGLVVFADNGKKARKYYHFEEIQTGLVLASVPTGMLLVDGVIRVVYLLPTLLRNMSRVDP